MNIYAMTTNTEDPGSTVWTKGDGKEYWVIRSNTDPELTCSMTVHEDSTLIVTWSEGIITFDTNLDFQGNLLFRYAEITV